jgi:hypothetical protein
MGAAVGGNVENGQDAALGAAQVAVSMISGIIFLRAASIFGCYSAAMQAIASESIVVIAPITSRQVAPSSIASESKFDIPVSRSV